MGCWTSKEAVSGSNVDTQHSIPDQVNSPAVVATPPPDSVSNGAETNGIVEHSAVDVDVHELEARDSVSQLAERPRQIQFGEVTTHSYEQPPLEEAHSHLLLQKSLPQIPVDKVDLETRVGCCQGTAVGVHLQLWGADRLLHRTQAAGLKHIGFGPLKKENQDEFFVQVSGYGGQPDGHCYCIFDGHGTHGRDAAQFCRQELPVLFDQELKAYYARAAVGHPRGMDANIKRCWGGSGLQL